MVSAQQMHDASWVRRESKLFWGETLSQTRLEMHSSDLCRSARRGGVQRYGGHVKLLGKRPMGSLFSSEISNALLLGVKNDSTFEPNHLRR